LFDELCVDITRRFDLPRGTVYVAAAFKGIESLPLEVFEPRRIGKPQQMTDAENGLTETEGIRRVDIASGHVVVHQPVDDECALTLPSAEDERVKQQIALVNKAVDTHSLAFTEVFERVVGVERLGAYFEFLAVAGGMQSIRGATRDVRQFQPVDESMFGIEV
jgi:hypothetical protein